MCNEHVDTCVGWRPGLRNIIRILLCVYRCTVIDYTYVLWRNFGTRTQVCSGQG